MFRFFTAWLMLLFSFIKYRFKKAFKNSENASKKSFLLNFSFVNDQYKINVHHRLGALGFRGKKWQMFIAKICVRHGQMRKEKRNLRKNFKSLDNFRVFSQQPKTKINMDRNFVKFRQHRRKWKRHFWFNPCRCPAPGIFEHIWDFIGTWLEWTTLTL